MSEAVIKLDAVAERPIPTVGKQTAADLARSELRSLAEKLVAGDVDELDVAAQIRDLAGRTQLPVDALRKAFSSERGKLVVATPNDDAKLVFGVAPVSTPYSLDVLLRAVVRIVAARVTMSPEAVCAVALWCTAAWGCRAAGKAPGPPIFPRLYVTSATPRCGKTTLLETIDIFVPASLRADNVTSAALFRTLAKKLRTLLIDEVDRFVRNSQELIGVINSGHQRAGTVLRTVEVKAGGTTTFDGEELPTFAPMVLAGIGRIAGTVEDRSITVRLERRAQGGLRQRLRSAKLEAIKLRFAGHLAAHADELAQAMADCVGDSLLPSGLNDRQCDNWSPLAAVAFLAGGAWPARMVRAAEVLAAEAAPPSPGESFLAQVYGAIRAERLAVAIRFGKWVRGGRNGSRPPRLNFIPSDVLAVRLMGVDDGPLAVARDVQAAKAGLARRLKPFRITPTQRWINGSTVRGYECSAVTHAWKRYR